MAAFPELIQKKRDGQELTRGDIETFVGGVVDGRMSDSQIGAMLMAMYLKDLSPAEVSALTNAMITSGSTLTWPAEWHGQLVDKHSTGGVGDKTSLVLAPVLAALGLKVPMISGRGLEHTGGTLDKLEAIPGFKVNLTQAEMTNVLQEVGCFIAGQTQDICPADKILYSLRDVTSTVSHIGLITASIISKKAAEKIQALVLDVKTGSGAFMQDEAKAVELARSLVGCSNSLGIGTTALLSDMNAPLGNMVGNALEVVESIQCLQGLGPADLLESVLDLGSHLLLSAAKTSSPEDGRQQLRDKIADGSALAKFRDMLKHQGVAAEIADDICDPKVDIWTRLTPSNHKTDFGCPQAGYIKSLNAMDVAVVSHKLGGGRNKPGEAINWAVGVQLHVAIGDQVEKDQVWVTVHHDHPLPPEVRQRLHQALTLSDTPVQTRPSRLRQVVH